ADGRLLKRLRDSGFADCEAITLIAPTDRGMLGEFRASGYATFLARPVRGETLLRVLLTSHGSAIAQPQPQPRGAASARRRDQGLSVLIAEDNDI
ncbi:hybrid sensor histidine kinase/response regulator, partial [Mesorhizobium sp. M2D.F.Ca.ET.223.01.1.1]